METEEVLKFLMGLTERKWDDAMCAQMSEKKTTTTGITIGECKRFVAANFGQPLCSVAIPLITRANMERENFAAPDPRACGELGALLYFIALVRLYLSIPTSRCQFEVSPRILESLRTHQGYDKKTSGYAYWPRASERPSSWDELRAGSISDDDEMDMFGSNVARIRDDQFPVSTIAHYSGVGESEITRARPGLLPKVAVQLEQIKQLIFSVECRKPMLDILAECFVVDGVFPRYLYYIREIVDELDQKNSMKSGRIHKFGYSVLFATERLKDMYRVASKVFGGEGLAGNALQRHKEKIEQQYGVHIDNWRQFTGVDPKDYLKFPKIDPLVDKSVVAKFTAHIFRRREQVESVIDALSAEYKKLRKLEENEDSRSQFRALAAALDRTTEGGGAEVSEEEIEELARKVKSGTAGVPVAAPADTSAKLKFNIFYLLHDVLAMCANYAEEYAKILTAAGGAAKLTNDKWSIPWNRVNADRTEVTRTDADLEKFKVVQVKPEGTTDEQWTALREAKAEELKKAGGAAEKAAILYFTTYLDFLDNPDGTNAPPKQKTFYDPLPLFGTDDRMDAVAEDIIRSCCAPEVASHFISTVRDLYTNSYRTGQRISGFDLSKKECRQAFKVSLYESWRRRDAINSNRDHKHPITTKGLDAETEIRAKVTSVLQKDSADGFPFDVRSRLPTGFTKNLKKVALQGIWKKFGSSRDALRAEEARVSRQSSSRSSRGAEDGGGGDDDAGGEKKELDF